MRCWKILVICAALLCSACSEEPIIIEGDDRCPEDPDKRAPGKCGCGVPDEDANDNGVIDCLEGADDDRCPEDPDKTMPGVCGCGVSDADADANGIVDCLESGIVDHCPTDPEKWDPGKCGCGVPDTASNIADSDGDGTLDCRDACPDNPNKTQPDAQGCDETLDEPDRDGDGMPDHLDACPDNPDIALEISDEVVDCDPSNIPVIEIRTAADLATLRQTLAALEGTTTEGQRCTGGHVCRDEKTILECHQGVWRTRECGACVNDTCTGAAEALQIPTPTYIVRVMNDINLGDILETSASNQGCTTSQWQSIPTMSNVRFEAVPGAAIRFTLADGTRCALPQALIHEAVMTEFRNLSLDFDLTASAQAALVDHVDSGTLSGIVFRGTLTTDAPKDVGGLVGYATANQDDLNMRFDGSYCQDAIIKAPKSSNVGCIAGRIVDAAISTGKNINLVASLSAQENAGGLVGMIQSAQKESQIMDAQNQVTVMDCQQYCGGALGICEGTGAISKVQNTLDVMNAVKGEYIGGFAGGIYLLKDHKTVTVSDISSKVNLLNAENGYYSAGFVAYTSGQVVYQQIENYISQLLGDFYTGGFAASAHHVMISDVDHIVSEMKAQNTTARPAFMGGFVAEAVGGVYTRIVSRVANLIHNSSTSGSLESEYQNSVAGFVGSVSEPVTFEYISSWAQIYANFITPAGFLGRLESGWTTESASHATINDVVSFSRIYKFTQASNILGSAQEYTKNYMAGTLSAYTASNAYFYQRSSGTALASSNGKFKPLTDANKQEVLSALQSQWNGWKAQDISLGAETLSSMPHFD